MSIDQRLKQLRTLLERVERLPDSPERTEMLRGLRARVVEVETGISDAPPRALRTARRADPQPAPAPAAPPRTARSPKPATPPPAPFAEPMAAETVPDAAELAGIDELLYLGELDLLAPHEEPEGTRGPVPWARGMRG